MIVEIGTEAAQFPKKEYINGIFLAVRVYREHHKIKRQDSIDPDFSRPCTSIFVFLPALHLQSRENFKYTRGKTTRKRGILCQKNMRPNIRYKWFSLFSFQSKNMYNKIPKLAPQKMLYKLGWSMYIGQYTERKKARNLLFHNSLTLRLFTRVFLAVGSAIFSSLE
jgi:hypothetical protein